jgi:hypothetical protein
MINEQSKLNLKQRVAGPDEGGVEPVKDVIR